MTMQRLYVLVFEQDKIISMSLGEYILVPVFESEEEAVYFSSNLQGSPSIVSIELEQIIYYAKFTGYNIKLIPQGMPLVINREKIELVQWSSEFYPERLRKVYILLFSSGKETEGVHSLKIDCYDIVLLFEAEDDAIRYSLLLEAQDFPTPTAEPMLIEEAIDSCNSAGYAWQIVKKEGLTLPPENNLEELDWQESQESQQNDSSLGDIDSLRRRLEGLL